jgi:hypothetical protein
VLSSFFSDVLGCCNVLITAYDQGKLTQKNALKSFQLLLRRCKDSRDSCEMWLAATIVTIIDPNLSS